VGEEGIVYLPEKSICAPGGEKSAESLKTGTEGGGERTSGDQKKEKGTTGRSGQCRERLEWGGRGWWRVDEGECKKVEGRRL